MNPPQINSQSTFIQLTPHFTVLDIWKGFGTSIWRFVPEVMATQTRERLFSTNNPFVYSLSTPMNESDTGNYLDLVRLRPLLQRTHGGMNLLPPTSCGVFDTRAVAMHRRRPRNRSIGLAHRPARFRVFKQSSACDNWPGN